MFNLDILSIDVVVNLLVDDFNEKPLDNVAPLK